MSGFTANGATVRRCDAGSRGQALVEFALVLPLFVVLLLAVFDFGRFVWARNSLENAAREAARYAIVHGGSELTTCPIGPDDKGRTCVGGSPDTTNGKNVARQAAIAAGDNLAVTICYGAGCSGDTSVDTNRPGAPVTVEVSSTMALVVPQLFRLFNVDIGTVRLDSTTTMIVNN